MQEIAKIEPIEGADRIEKATVLGWHCVVGKGEFMPGETVIFIEPDSVLPEKIATAIGFTDKHLKTRKFRGVYSQGLVLKTDFLDVPGSYPVGIDVTKELGIEKYEPDVRNTDNGEWWKKHKGKQPVPNRWYMKYRLCRWIWRKYFQKPVAGPFPTQLVPKTDETRVQILQDVLQQYEGTECEYTEKVDGSSITFWLERKKFLGKTKEILHVCSRNREIYDKKDFMYVTAEKLIPALRLLPDGIVLQGEIIGPNIQGNKYHVDHYEIYVYQAHMTGGEYLSPVTFRATMKKAGIQIVPQLGTTTITADADAFVALSEGPSVLYNKTPREGIVIRPLNNIQVNDSRFVDHRLSFKAINPKFLVKYKL